MTAIVLVAPECVRVPTPHYPMQPWNPVCCLPVDSNCKSISIEGSTCLESRTSVHTRDFPPLFIREFGTRGQGLKEKGKKEVE